jgi:altronate dehydratase
MPSPLPLDAVGRLPAPGDNVAIAIRRLEAGTAIALPGGSCALAHTVLEGHRFAVQPIAQGEALLSWGFPFGRALSAIAAGDYVCNRSMLDALAVRQLDGVRLPAEPNFSDVLAPFELDEEAFRAGAAVERAAAPGTFAGYRRAGGRGVGTRNFVVIVGTTSRTASFARQLAARLQALARVSPSLDGIVAVAHTEGGGPGEPHNVAEVLRSLAGFLVHPNCGAVLAVDYGVEPINNARLRAFMEENGYPLSDVPHSFLTMRGGFSAGLAEGERMVRGWLPEVAAQRRTEEPISELRIALQCGGSDAFSGVSGNPLAGAIVHEVIRHGGCGVLTETDEAVGAEAYLLRSVRDLATARRFLDAIDQFRRYLAWHGVTFESNPSGGNKLRGLYNIALKSVGAVHKKDPRTRLENVIEYAEPLRLLGEPGSTSRTASGGFSFMNGPGNDLEGIAGQVAAGCNLILFVTGNGSVTNFPFVPTLKITTTTRRHQLLIHEMDINAGRYLDGEPMESLAQEAFALTLATASGQKTKGEAAGHAQVSLWRNWPQADGTRLAALQARGAPDGIPLRRAERRTTNEEPGTIQLFRTGGGFATERVGLVLPTSLCSSQIARLAADRLNAAQLGREQGISRFVALPHTEACGASGETLYRMLGRSYRGYLTHPNVAAALLLEHGCEKITNDAMRHELADAGVPAERFGWASVQLDGGIAQAFDKIEAWFREKLATVALEDRVTASLGALAVGFMTAAPVGETTAVTLANLANTIIERGGSVLLPESDPLLADATFRRLLLGSVLPHATLASGQPLNVTGLHVVATETEHWVENLTALGACGAHAAITVVSEHSRQGHPLLPVVQVAEAGAGIAPEDLDLTLTAAPAADAEALETLLIAVAERRHVPAANATGCVDFQFTRGWLGVTS